MLILNTYIGRVQDKDLRQIPEQILDSVELPAGFL